jgi:Tetratricopeptide repeat
MRIFVVLAIATALLAPLAVAQKPPAPPPPSSTPPPPATSNPPGLPTSPSPSVPDSIQSSEERVMFLTGRVATNDNTPVPIDAVVQRICNNKVHEHVYASSRGDFSLQLGSRADSFLAASDESSSQSGANSKDSTLGIPRRDLSNCELHATAAGFYSDLISLAAFDTFTSRIDVGVVVLQRISKIKGNTVNAAAYMAPKDATRAYEKGLEAERKSNPAAARKYFETAVAIYPKYVGAWYQLGTLLQKDHQNDAARKAFTEATALDTRFLPPYLSLASMAYEDENWTDVLALTDHILDRDPLNHAEVTGYIVDLDPANCSEAYFFNAAANYNLHKFADAEKSGLKAEHLDMITRFPQLHLLLGEIFARKNDYAGAISELQTYLDLAPHAQNADLIREQLAQLHKLNGSVSASEKPDPK